MANNQFITEITAAQLAAMIALSTLEGTEGGLDEGRIYNITDSKQWIMATSTSTYIVLPEKEHIFNGQSMAGAPQILLIDTGIVVDDLATEGGTPLEIDFPAGYVYHSMETLIGAENTVTNIAYASGYITASDNIAPGFRAILTFVKSDMSVAIPVPTLLDASTNTAGTLVILTFDHDMKDPSAAVADFTCHINATPDTVTGVALGTDTKTIEVTTTSTILNGDIVSISVAADNVMNIWGGLMPVIADVVVNNIVPED